MVFFVIVLLLLKSLFCSPNPNKIANEGPRSDSVVQKGSDAKIALEVTNENMRTEENPRELAKSEYMDPQERSNVCLIQ